MTFTEPRSDVHDLAAAIEKMVRAKGRGWASLQYVLKDLPNYIHLTRGDLRRSPSRPREAMWQTEVRNVTRNQNRNPTYRKFPPIPNCPLEYKNGRFILRELDDLRDERGAHNTEKLGHIQRAIIDPMRVTVRVVKV